MEQLRSYLLSLIVTTLICSLLPELLSEGGPKTLVKTFCGLVVAVTALLPLRKAELQLPSELPLFQEEAAFAAAEGEALGADALRSVIKSRAEAYILDKGAQWCDDLRVELELEDSPPYAPSAARIFGEFTEEGKGALQQLLASEFAIPKEAQTWMP